MADRNSNGKAEISQLDEHLMALKANEPFRCKMKSLFRQWFKPFFIFSGVMVLYSYSLVWLFPDEPERMERGYIYEAFEFREDLYAGDKSYFSSLADIYLADGRPGDSLI